jgi:hypothetical protein
MTRKIALEEHFLVEGFANTERTQGRGRSGVPPPGGRAVAGDRCARLEAMDGAGIDLAVLSLCRPGIQGERYTVTAIRDAKAVNDTRADRQPSRALPRFRGGDDAGSAGTPPTSSSAR